MPLNIADPAHRRFTPGLRGLELPLVTDLTVYNNPTYLISRR
jgi:hypothetical protein